MKNKSFKNKIIELYFKGYNFGGKVNEILHIFY